ncbi:hypothetical protein DFJ74DRAFT_693171 [Hyaloraphidium curvatum]|nr:hypothetical protein DFJ74DRAFT_693171 [Hyaloraphidium curvatum]
MLAAIFAVYCAALGLLGAEAAQLERRQFWRQTGVFDVMNCTNPRHFALTFDDGPSPLTPTLLDHLRRKNAKATFFVLGIQVDARPQILIQAFNEGHQIAAHSYVHASFPSLGSAGVLGELQKTEQAIVSKIGVAPVYMRPPFGDVDQASGSVIREFGQKIAVWNMDSGDTRLRGNTQAVIDAFGAVPPPSSAPGIIAVAHDTLPSTVEAVPAVIDLLRAKGFELVTLAECNGGAAAYKGGNIPAPAPSTAPPAPTSPPQVVTQPPATATPNPAPTSTVTNDAQQTTEAPSKPTGTASPSPCDPGCGAGYVRSSCKWIHRG